MNVDRVEGIAKRLKGSALKVWGRATGDVAMERRGQALSLAGSAQANFGRAMGVARSAFAPRRRLGV